MKYELTNIKDDYRGTTIYRIRALEDIRNDFESGIQFKVRKGDLGGWVSGYHNLSQQGKCWIYDNSIVTDNARVEDDAIVYGNSIMHGNSSAYNRSQIKESYLFKNSMVLGDAYINSSRLYDDSKVMRSSLILFSTLMGNTQIRLSHSNIKNSLIDNSIILSIADIEDSTIIRSIITGGAFVNFSNITSCVIKLSEIVNSNLENIEADFYDIYNSTNITSVNHINNIKSMLFHQCNLFSDEDYVIAYKIVNQDFSSFHDRNFFYKVGEVIEEPNTNLNIEEGCTSGLHFSSPNYWIKNINRNEKHFLLKAKIKLDDIVAIKLGKLRCKRAEILGYFEV